MSQETKTAAQELDELKGRVSQMKEDYERRLESAKGMLEELKKEEDPNQTTLSAINRLVNKSSEYRTIIAELNKLI